MEESINNSLKYGQYYIEKLHFRYQIHLRIITLDPIYNGYCFIFSSVRWNEDDRRGWSKPDKQIGPDLELRRIWKDVTILSYTDWVKYGMPSNMKEEYNNIRDYHSDNSLLLIDIKQV